MNRVYRLRFLILALLLAVSQVVLVGHLAAHSQFAVEHCALCASHAQPHAAVPVADAPPPIVVVDVYWSEPASASVTPVSPNHYHQRAPPVTSS
jgi:hypothetical protein